MDATEDVEVLGKPSASAPEHAARAYRLAKETAIRAQNAVAAAACALREVEAREGRLLERSRAAARWGSGV
jgi:hypothetical protein